MAITKFIKVQDDNSACTGNAPKCLRAPANWSGTVGDYFNLTLALQTGFVEDVGCAGFNAANSDCSGGGTTNPPPGGGTNPPPAGTNPIERVGIYYQPNGTAFIVAQSNVAVQMRLSNEGGTSGSWIDASAFGTTIGSDSYNLRAPVAAVAPGRYQVLVRVKDNPDQVRTINAVVLGSSAGNFTLFPTNTTGGGSTNPPPGSTNPPPATGNPIDRVGIYYTPNGNTFVVAQSGVPLQVRLTNSQGQSSAFVDMSSFSSQIGSDTYNQRGLIANVAPGTYTVNVVVKGTSTFRDIPGVVLGNSQQNYTLYPTNQTGGGSNPPPGNTSPLIRGSFESLQCRGAYGWCYDENNRNQPRTVELVLNGNVIGSTLANLSHSQASNAGWFYNHPGGADISTGPFSVTARDKDTGTVIGTQTITCTGSNNPPPYNETPQLLRGAIQYQPGQQVFVLVQHNGTRTPQVRVVSFGYDSNWLTCGAWDATVEAESYNQRARAVGVPAGTHKVQFRFEGDTSLVAEVDVTLGGDPLMKKVYPIQAEQLKIDNIGISYVPGSHAFLLLKASQPALLRIDGGQFDSGYRMAEPFATQINGVSYNYRVYVAGVPAGSYTVQGQFSGNPASYVSASGVVLGGSAVERTVYPVAPGSATCTISISSVLYDFTNNKVVADITSTGLDGPIEVSINQTTWVAGPELIQNLVDGNYTLYARGKNKVDCKAQRGFTVACQPPVKNAEPTLQVTDGTQVTAVNVDFGTAGRMYRMLVREVTPGSQVRFIQESQPGGPGTLQPNFPLVAGATYELRVQVPGNLTCETVVPLAVPAPPPPPPPGGGEPQ